LLIINIIKDEKPFTSVLIPEAILDKFEYVDFNVLTAWEFDLVRDIPKTLLQPGFITRMDPKYPGPRRLGSHLIGVFDGELRFTSNCEPQNSISVTYYLPDTSEADQRYS
jgi:hypothetical protein